MNGKKSIFKNLKRISKTLKGINKVMKGHYYLNLKDIKKLGKEKLMIYHLKLKIAKRKMLEIFLI